jgi:hypothetical protein
VGGSFAGRLRLNYCIFGVDFVGLGSCWVVEFVCVCVRVQICWVYRSVAHLFFLCLFLCCLIAFFPFAISAAFAGFSGYRERNT